MCACCSQLAPSNCFLSNSFNICFWLECSTSKRSCKRSASISGARFIAFMKLEAADALVSRTKSQLPTINAKRRCHNYASLLQFHISRQTKFPKHTQTRTQQHIHSSMIMITDFALRGCGFVFEYVVCAHINQCNQTDQTRPARPGHRRTYSAQIQKRFT